MDDGPAEGPGVVEAESTASCHCHGTCQRMIQVCSFAPIAGRAAGYKVAPLVAAAPGSGYHMVDGVSLGTAVVADTVIPDEHRGADSSPSSRAAFGSEGACHQAGDRDLRLSDRDRDRSVGPLIALQSLDNCPGDRIRI